jgi:hypothetical protein
MGSCGLMDKALPEIAGSSPAWGYVFWENVTAGMAKWQGNRFVSGRSGVRTPLPAFFSWGSPAKNFHAGIWTRVLWVKTTYPNQLDYTELLAQLSEALCPSG